MSARSVFLLAAFAAVAAFPTSARGQALPTSDDCRSCHLGLADEALAGPARAYENDVHAAAGLGCLACHGSGGADRLDPRAGFLAAPTRAEIPGLCGRCHSDAAYMREFDPAIPVDQVAEYWTSGHGQRLRADNDQEVATCIDCHPAHSIRPPDDPASAVYPANIVATCGRCHADADRMAGRGIATDQVAEYSTSVHGRMLLEARDLSAPVCNDCHGNHGSAPSGLTSVYGACAQCHSVMGGFFEASGHQEIFEERDLPGCAVCHQDHGIQPVADASLGEFAAGVCERCHLPPDTLGLQFGRMAAVLDTLLQAEAASLALLEEAENVGMEVSQAFFELEDLNNVQTRAHSAIHAFSIEPVREEVAAGLAITARAEERGRAALAEYHVRRVGLGLSSTIIVLLIVGLFLKIRQIERPEGP